MLRFSIALLVAIAVSDTAESADRPLLRQSSYHGWRRTALILPAGLPRPHYNFRTTISYGPPSAYRWTYGPPLVETPEPRYAPVYVGVPTLPGYDGSTYSYDYEGPYYGGPYVSYWDRLPHACGVYGYC